MLKQSEVFRLWLPLAASWLLMGAEGPLFTWCVGGMAEQKVSLGAFGSIAFPIALVVEGPIIMLLAASTALCKDWDSYRKVRRFMIASSVALTLLHIAIAFTPLFEVVVIDILGIPQTFHESGRLGLQILTPWTAAIAYRRFLQGVMIRFGHSRRVMIGTAIRLCVLLSTMVLARELTDWSGIVVGTLGVASGVTAEALFARFAVVGILRDRMPQRADGEEVLHRGAFLKFYLPLAVTPLMTLFIGPAGAAAMSRMPMEELSLAGWQVVHALVFLTRGSGFAFNEVVVALLDKPGARAALNRFALVLAGCMAGLLALISWKPVSNLILGNFYQLEPDLLAICSTALLFAIAMPAYQVAQSLFQGQLVHAKRTRGVTEAVTIYVVVSLLGLRLATHWLDFPGIYAVLVVFSTGGILQTLWLAVSAAKARRPS